MIELQTTINNMSIACFIDARTIDSPYEVSTNPIGKDQNLCILSIGCLEQVWNACPSGTTNDGYVSFFYVNVLIFMWMRVCSNLQM
jgi:hypothetical protein